MRTNLRSDGFVEVFDRIGEKAGELLSGKPGTVGCADLGARPVWHVWSFEASEYFPEGAWRVVHTLHGGTLEDAAAWLLNYRTELLDGAIDSYEARLEGISEER